MTAMTRNERLNRQLFASICCGLFICCFSLLLIVEGNFSHKRSDKKHQMELKLKKLLDCYRSNASQLDDEYEIRYLEDVMEAEVKPNPGESLFFHETTCFRSGLIHLSSRQACAIESAARLHPNRNVFVLFSSPVGFRESAQNLPANIQALNTYPNIHLRNNNLWKYAKDTPLEKWLSNGSWFGSTESFQRTFHALRYLTLYKFGGMFLESDVIVQQNLDQLGQNFAGHYDDDEIGCAVLNFNNDTLGRKIADRCIRLSMKFFDQTIDSHRSIVTTALEGLCQSKYRNSMEHEDCDGFHLHPRRTFYAVPRHNEKWFFGPKRKKHTLGLTKKSKVIRTWNNASKSKRIKLGSGTAYEFIAKLNCPKVFSSRINYEYF